MWRFQKWKAVPSKRVTEQVSLEHPRPLSANLTAVYGVNGHRPRSYLNASEYNSEYCVISGILLVCSDAFGNILIVFNNIMESHK